MRIAAAIIFLIGVAWFALGFSMLDATLDQQPS